MALHVVIMAGGSGTRLWPASTRARPKQFLRLGGEESLLLQTARRALALNTGGEICIVTGERLAALTRAELDDAGLAERVRVLAEPSPRNTAPAIMLAARWLASRTSVEDSMLVLTADHRVGPLPAFTADVGTAAALAEAGFLVTFGIAPDRPETGFGYIERGEALLPAEPADPDGAPASGSAARAFRVLAFREKPDEQTAGDYLASGRHYWNSGMFTFGLRVFQRELSEHAPQLWSAFGEHGSPTEADGDIAMTEGGWLGLSASLRAAWEAIPSISIDYAVMEHTRVAAVVPATFTWSDVGSWDEVAQAWPRGDGPAVLVQSDGAWVSADVPVTVCGAPGVRVVVRDGRVLVLGPAAGQLLKPALAEWEARGRSDLL